MGTVLVTGGTGLVGYAVLDRLRRDGKRVRALVRDVKRARNMLGPDIELCEGDVTAKDSLEVAMRGVDLLFHSAGIPEQWQRDEGLFDRVNRGGTANVLRAARRAGVRRAVYTSTMDVFAAPPGGTLVETSLDAEPKPTAYERSKQAAEREAEAALRDGLDVVFVNPGAVYGPSPVITALNVFIVKLLKGQVPILPPGGMPVAFVDGVAAAHVAAAERGRTGERYLVADEHLSTAALAAAVLAAQGAGKKTPPVGSAALLKLVARTMAPLARTFGFTPLVASGELSFLLWDVRIDAAKARRELGFVPTSPAVGVPRTVEAFQGR